MAVQLPRGVPTLLRLVRLICRAAGKFGTAGLSQSTTPELAAAVATLVAACHVFELLDDNVWERDDSGTPDPFPAVPTP